MYKSLKGFRQDGTKVERCKQLMWRVKSTTIAATLLLCAVFMSCKQTEEKKDKVKDLIYSYNNCDVKLIKVDSCEYIVAQSTTSTGGLSIIHKQNCKHCAFKSK